MITLTWCKEQYESTSKLAPTGSELFNELGDKFGRNVFVYQTYALERKNGKSHEQASNTIKRDMKSFQFGE